MRDDPPKPSVRSRLPLWGGLLVLILLVPAILIPLLVGAFREPAFTEIDEVNPADVRAIEVFILNRPDDGADIGAKQPFAVPATDFERVLGLLRNAERVTAETPRGIWLGRIAVTLADGRSQTILLHRPKNEYDAAAVQRVELRIGPHQFVGPMVNEFTARMGEIAGVEPPPRKLGK